MNLQIERTAFDVVTDHERQRGRIVARAPRGSGYDLTSKGPGGDLRRIEVKSTRKPVLTARWLEPEEFSRLERDPDFWLYAVVDCGGTPRVAEFDRGAIRERYVGPITKHALRFRRADFDA